ncbi:hypothetical protein D3C75_1020180 [compost metagenome]
MYDPGIELTLEAFDHRTRCGSAADDHTVQAQLVARLQLRVFDVLLQHHPHGRHAKCQGHAFITHQLVQRGSVGDSARQYQPGTGQSPRIRHAPGVDMEHRHHHQRHVITRQGKAAGGAGCQRVQHR